MIIVTIIYCWDLEGFGGTSANCTSTSYVTLIINVIIIRNVIIIIIIIRGSRSCRIIIIIIITITII